MEGVGLCLTKKPFQHLLHCSAFELELCLIFSCCVINYSHISGSMVGSTCVSAAVNRENNMKH